MLPYAYRASLMPYLAMLTRLRLPYLLDTHATARSCTVQWLVPASARCPCDALVRLGRHRTLTAPHQPVLSRGRPQPLSGLPVAARHHRDDLVNILSTTGNDGQRYHLSRPIG